MTEPRRIRDVDSAERAHRIRAFSWSFLGAIPFALIGSRVGADTSSPLLVTAAFAAGGFAFMFFGSLWIGESLGRSAGSTFFPSGRSTAGEREYSLAESLIVRGRLDEAIGELERAAAAYPEDTIPVLRLARLLRDQCRRPEDAARWFREALKRSRDANEEIGVVRELIELYVHRLGEPRRALPELARLAEKHVDAPAGAWAKRELGEIRRTLQSEEEP